MWKPGTLFISTARSEVIAIGALPARLQKGDVPAALDVIGSRAADHADAAICHVPGIVLTRTSAGRTGRRVQGAHPPDDRLPDRLLRRRGL